mmetsp:Transcript_18632/g.43879  ORF Transcript_18632/g.43879 Transcript_18632/m.43879 type:complete len:218 (-) Transcript_18632:1225-1878(-)
MPRVLLVCAARLLGRLHELSVDVQLAHQTRTRQLGKGNVLLTLRLQCRGSEAPRLLLFPGLLFVRHWLAHARPAAHGGACRHVWLRLLHHPPLLLRADAQRQPRPVSLRKRGSRVPAHAQAQESENGRAVCRLHREEHLVAARCNVPPLHQLWGALDALSGHLAAADAVAALATLLEQLRQSLAEAGRVDASLDVIGGNVAHDPVEPHPRLHLRLCV